MALNLDRIREKQAALQRKSGNIWKPTDGAEVKNLIRIFKFTHKVTKEEVAKNLFSKKDLGNTVEEFDRMAIRHFGMRADNRPVLSNKALMQKYNELKSSDKKASDTMRPTKTYFMNIVDTNDIEGGMKIWGCPSTAFDLIIGTILDPDYGEDVLGCKGRDFVIKLDKTKVPALMYQVSLRKEGKSSVLPSDLQKNVIDLYSPDALAYMGELQDDEGTHDPDTDYTKGFLKDPDEDEEEEEEKKKVDEEDDLKDEEDEEEAEEKDDEDDEDEKPAKKKKVASRR